MGSSSPSSSSHTFVRVQPVVDQMSAGRVCWRVFPIARFDLYDGRVAEVSVDSDSEMIGLTPPAHGDDWTGMSSAALPVQLAAEWVVLPSCGGVVVFTGTARDHSVGRTDVTKLEYEAYEEQVVPRLDAIAAEARRRWPDIGRIVLLHRVDEVPITEAAVIVAVSAPHRAEAFEAARFGIDTLKSTVPVSYTHLTLPTTPYV